MSLRLYRKGRRHYRRARGWWRHRVCSHRGHVEQWKRGVIRIKEAGKSAEWLDGWGLNCARCQESFGRTVTLQNRVLVVDEPICVWGPGVTVSGIHIKAGDDAKLPLALIQLGR